MEHTKEPWCVRGGYSIYASDKKTPIADACLNNSVAAKDEANARRIVACVNACRGIPTENLEKGNASSDKYIGATIGTLCVELEVFKQQRDELLAAAKLFRAYAHFSVTDADGYAEAVAAIAKVKP